MIGYDIDAHYDTLATNSDIAADKYHNALFDKLARENGIITSDREAYSISSIDAGKYERFAIKSRINECTIIAIDIFGNEEMLKMIDGSYVIQDNKPSWAK